MMPSASTSSSSPNLHRHQYFSSEASIYTHYFQIQSSSIPSHYLKTRECGSLFRSLNRALPDGVLILKRPETKASVHRSRYKWFYERQSMLKSKAFPKFVLQESDSRLIIRKENSLFDSTTSLLGAKQLMTSLDKDASKNDTADDDQKRKKRKRRTQDVGNMASTSVWKFISCDDEDALMYQNEVLSSSPAQKGSSSVSSDASSDEDASSPDDQLGISMHSDTQYANSHAHDEYYIQYYDGRYLCAKGGKQSERVLYLSNHCNPYSKWKIRFCERRQLDAHESQLLQKLAIEEQSKYDELSQRASQVQFRVLKPKEMEYFWDVAQGRSPRELSSKYEVIHLLNLVDEFGYNSLMRAVLRRRHELIEYFLSFPEELTSKMINHRNDSEQTCLHIAAYMGDVKTLKMLMDFGGIPLHSKDRDAHTPLMDAVEKGNSLSAVQMLCTSTDCIRFVSARKQNVFHLACASVRGNAKILEYLLSFDVGASQLCLRRDDIGYTPLHYAVQNNHVELVRLLLPHQNSNTFNLQTYETKETVLHIACRNRNQKMLDTLLYCKFAESVDYSVQNVEGLSIKQALFMDGLVLKSSLRRSLVKPR